MAYRTTRYRSTPPIDDWDIQCSVCSFGIEDEKTSETPETVYTYTVTGTVWHAADPTQVDKTVVSTIPAYTNCPLCGSNMFRSGGRRGTL